MIFEWPMLLWALLLVPVLVLAYLMMERRRQRVALTVARWSRNPNANIPANPSLSPQPSVHRYFNVLRLKVDGLGHYI